MAHLVQSGVSRDAGIVDENLHRSQSIGDIRHRRLGRGKIRYVPVTHRYAGFDGEFCGGIIGSPIAAHHAIALGFE